MILLRLSLTPSLQEFEARHSHSILESYSEYHRQGLDFPDSHECRHQSSLYHEDPNISDSVPCISNLRDIRSIGGRTEVVVRHAFIGNDDDCHVHHIQVEVRMNILEAE